MLHLSYEGVNHQVLLKLGCKLLFVYTQAFRAVFAVLYLEPGKHTLATLPANINLEHL